MPTINLCDHSERGDKWLHENILTHKQEIIPDNFKLYIEYKNYDVFKTNNAGESLIALHKTLKEIDFPHFFVKLITTNTDIKKHLDYCTKYFSDEVDNISFKIEPGQFVKKYVNKDTVCIYPWIHFYINPQGQIGQCCHFNNSFPLGNVNDEDVNNLHNIKGLRELRKDMLKRKQPPGCSVCWKKEDNNILSPRQITNKSWSKYKHLIDQTQLDGSFNNFKLRYLDVRLSNACNFMCRMCSGKFSNKIAQEEKQLYGYTKYLDEHIKNNTAEQLMAHVEKNIYSLERIYFAGGEPLINETHYKILNLLINADKTNIELSYNTNFSLLRFKQYDVLDYWKNFNNIIVGASIDLIGPAANYVRYGAEYEVLEKNYHLIKNLPNITFNITSILHSLNTYNLPKLQKHWIDNIKLSAEHMVFDLVIQPSNMQITVLPSEYKKELTKIWENHITYLKTKNGSEKLVSQWKQAIKFMNSKDDSHLLKDFFRLNNDKDRARNQQFEDYFPEFLDLRSYAI